MNFQEKNTVTENNLEKIEPSIKDIDPYAYSRLMNPKWRREVLERVDHLIRQISDNHIENLIFLDKSARPLSWLIRARMKHLGDDTIPNIQFIDLGGREITGGKTTIETMTEEATTVYENLDANSRITFSDDDDWSSYKNICFSEGNDIEGQVWMSKKNISEIWLTVTRLHPELIEEIRSRYGTQPGKTLIIDELLFSGTTLRAAVAIFTEAYPNSEVFGVHFFNQASKRPTTQIPWFKKQYMIGVEEAENSLTTKRYSSPENQKPDLSHEFRAIINEIAQTNKAE